MCIHRFNPSEPSCNPDEGCGRCRCVPAAWKLTTGVDPAGLVEGCQRFAGTHTLTRNDPDEIINGTRCSWETPSLNTEAVVAGWHDQWIFGFGMRFVSIAGQLASTHEGWQIVMPAFFDAGASFLVAQWWLKDPPFRCMQPNTFELIDGRGNDCAGLFPEITLSPVWCA